jgi:hypothetical protein
MPAFARYDRIDRSALSASNVDRAFRAVAALSPDEFKMFVEKINKLIRWSSPTSHMIVKIEGNKTSCP